jgi:hypothetical protein
MFTKLFILGMHNIIEVSAYESDVRELAERGRDKINLEIINDGQRLLQRACITLRKF